MSARSSLNFPNNLTQVPINIMFAGNTTLVAGTPGKATKVFRLKMIIGAAATVSFFDGPDLLDLLVFPTPGAMVLDFSSIDMPPWYETSDGNDLVVGVSAPVQLSGNLDYLQS